MKLIKLLHTQFFLIPIFTRNVFLIPIFTCNVFLIPIFTQCVFDWEYPRMIFKRFCCIITDSSWKLIYDGCWGFVFVTLFAKYSLKIFTITASTKRIRITHSQMFLTDSVCIYSTFIYENNTGQTIWHRHSSEKLLWKHLRYSQGNVLDEFHFFA